ncbi:MAG: HNH endonuclease [Alphaproteobacteria bacterium]|nr:HNH endonuclease [Alphaproteobacteria bacterium]
MSGVAKRQGSKQKVREFFLANIGKVVTSAEIQAAAGGAVQYSRRLRELREQEGWKILSHNDTPELKPGEYLLKEAPPAKGAVKMNQGISARLRAQVFDRNGFTCVMCGLTPGEIDPYTGRSVRLHVGHIIDKSLGGKDELSNLRTLCSTCNQGAKNVTTEKPSRIWLLAQVRRAQIADQQAVFERLKTKFTPKLDAREANAESSEEEWPDKGGG